MKQFLSILILFGLGLSMGVPENPNNVFSQCSKGLIIKCPMSDKIILANASPISCPKTGKSSKCQKKFLNLFIVSQIDNNIEFGLLFNYINALENLLVNQKFAKLQVLYIPPDNPSSSGNLPLLI